jgi:hypothetical protein
LSTILDCSQAHNDGRGVSGKKITHTGFGFDDEYRQFGMRPLRLKYDDSKHDKQYQIRA